MANEELTTSWEDVKISPENTALAKTLVADAIQAGKLHDSDYSPENTTGAMKRSTCEERVARELQIAESETVGRQAANVKIHAWAAYFRGGYEAIPMPTQTATEPTSQAKNTLDP
jgi:hypothetical protein